MNINTITIELCKEDRQRLDELIAFAGLIAGELKSGSAPRTEEPHPIDAPTAPWEPADAPAPAPAAEPAAVEPVPAEPDPEVKPVSLAEFQKAVTQAVAKGQKQKAAAKEIINKYAASVSAVPEDKRAEVMAELAKI
jgi:hypothetical protein